MWKHNLTYGNEPILMGILIMINFIKFAKRGSCKIIQVREGGVPCSPYIIEADYINYFGSENCQHCNMKNVTWIIRKHSFFVYLLMYFFLYTLKNLNCINTA